MAQAIIDSGSTKADWRIVTGSEVMAFQTTGYNPYFSTADEIRDSIKKEIVPNLQMLQIDRLYFYGAGCAAEERKNQVRLALSQSFENAEIYVDTDLLGAAHGLLGNETGLVAILGTGTNSGIYNGKEIIVNVDSAGYFLGDEGSGAYLGKLILRNWLRKIFSDELQEKFTRFISLSREEVFNRLYHQPFPNRFLAGFAHFAAENITHQQIEGLIRTSFRDFISNILKQYDGYKNFPLYVTGSIGYVFRELLKKECSEANIATGTISQSPIEGLVKYHLA